MKTPAENGPYFLTEASLFLPCPFNPYNPFPISTDKLLKSHIGYFAQKIWLLFSSKTESWECSVLN